MKEVYFPDELSDGTSVIVEGHWEANEEFTVSIWDEEDDDITMNVREDDYRRLFARFKNIGRSNGH